MNPFAQLLSVAERPDQLDQLGTLPRRSSPGRPAFTMAAVVDELGPKATKTETLLYLLGCNAALTTRQLADGAAMDTRLVWGLLRGPKRRGQAVYRDGLWSLNHDWMGSRHGAALAALGERLADLTTPRPLATWHEDDGAALWWSFPIDEPPYCGSPLSSDWPRYHTHWTPLPAVVAP